MSTIPTATPKAFISYSWSSEQHVAWVLELASRLMQDGVVVVLDKWDLKVGHDANAFMESMVTDPSVTKVLLVCDRVYAEKANGRAGGVGKEAQILTREIYEKVAQDKYAALVLERDEEGRPYAPAYYGGRQYIDFSEADRAETAYEELLRWIWNKPQFVKPKLGEPPAFINNPDEVVTATTSRFKRADEAIRSGRPHAGGLIMDFGEALLAELSERAPDTEAKPYDEEVVRVAESMQPALRNLCELFLAEARFNGGNMQRFLQILERMARLMFRPQDVRSWTEWDFDPYRMICYEAFLSLTAILTSERRFDLLGAALRYAYLVEGREHGDGRATATFRVFSQDISSFAERKRRLGSRQYDLYADLVAETYAVSFPTVQQLVEADVLLYLRSRLVEDASDYEQWWPRMIIYTRRSQPLSLFARSESAGFFEAWAPQVFGPVTISRFQEQLAALAGDFGGMYGYPPPNIARLTSAQHIGTRD